MEREPWSGFSGVSLILSSSRVGQKGKDPAQVSCSSLHLWLLSSSRGRGNTELQATSLSLGAEGSGKKDMTQDRDKERTG